MSTGLLGKIKNFMHSAVTQNFMWIVGEQIFEMLVSFVISIISARYLGPSDFGTLNYTVSFVNFFTSVATLGMNGVIIKKLIESPDKEGEILGSCIVFRFAASIFSCFAIVGVVWILNPSEPIKVLLAAVQSLQLVCMAANILDSYFQRYLKSKHVSIAKMITCVVVSAYRIYILVEAKSILWFAFSSVFTYLIMSVCLYIAYKRDSSQKLSFSVNSGMLVLKDSYQMIISGLLVSIYAQVDKIMLGGMISDEAVGFYTTASTLCVAWDVVPTAIYNSLTPKVMELHTRGDMEGYKKKLGQTYSLVMWSCLIMTVAVNVLAHFIIKTLYGDAYLGAVMPLRILFWADAFTMLGSARQIWFICENKLKYTKYCLGMGSVANLILNAFLIPVYGASGAAFATLVTQVFTCLIAPLLFKETRMHTGIVLNAFVFGWARKQTHK